MLVVKKVTAKTYKHEKRLNFRNSEQAKKFFLNEEEFTTDEYIKLIKTGFVEKYNRARGETARYTKL
jgi:hypothetical protein